MSRTPPGPAGSSLTQLLALRKDFLGYLLEAARLGDLVLLRPAPGMTLWLVNHPDLVEEVLVRRADAFHKSAMTRRMVGKFLGIGLVLAEGDQHRAQRRRVQPAFHGAQLRALEGPIRAATEALGWSPGQRIDVEAEMTALTLRVIARVLFGSDRAPSAELTHAMEQFATSIASRFRSVPLPDWLPTPRNRAERAAIEVLDRAIRGAGSAGLAGALVDAGADPVEVRDQLVTLYFAGHETTAKWLTWTLYLLAAHPDVQARAADDDLLLDRVLAESLRLYPPTWVFDRQAVAPIDLGGYTLPEGAVLYVSPWVSHRDPRFWTDPDRFDPERFVAPSVPRGAYYPFGFGPRNCVGRGLAELNAKVALQSLLSRWRFRTRGTGPRPEPAATLRPKEPLLLDLVPA